MTVGISEARIVNDPSAMLVTHSLGSCVAISVWCPVTKVSGLLHYQLPDSEMDLKRAGQNPLMFCDTGLRHLLDKVAKLGGQTKRLEIKLAGGAKMLQVGTFDIGHRNHLAARKQIWKHGLFVKAEDCGGTAPRTLYLRASDGAVRLRINGKVRAL